MLLVAQVAQVALQRMATLVQVAQAEQQLNRPQPEMQPVVLVVLVAQSPVAAAVAESLVPVVLR